MPTALVLTDNIFSTSQYPDHLITASEEATDHGALLVGDGRRAASDYWTSATANTAAWNRVQCNRPRGANCMIIDRGHNLAGKDVNIEGSNDGFTSSEVVQSIPSFPSYSVPGSSVDDALGVVTEEGAWIKRFSFQTFRDWRLYVAAGGASYKPQVVGIYLGPAWTPPTPDFPWSEDEEELVVQETQTDYAWLGVPAVSNRRSGSLSLRLRDTDSYGQARLNTLLFVQRNPAWLIYDVQQAERAVCTICRGGATVGLRLDRDWTNKRRVDWPWMEHEPKALA